MTDFNFDDAILEAAGPEETLIYTAAKAYNLAMSHDKDSKEYKKGMHDYHDNMAKVAKLKGNERLEKLHASWAAKFK